MILFQKMFDMIHILTYRYHCKTSPADYLHLEKKIVICLLRFYAYLIIYMQICKN